MRISLECQISFMVILTYNRNWMITFNVDKIEAIFILLSTEYS